MTIAASGYQIRPVAGQLEWDACFSSIHRPHLMQSWAYGQAKKNVASWCTQRYVFEKAGRPVAICQVLEKRLAGLRVVARINRGPLFLEEQPCFEAKENVFRLLRKKWRFPTGGPLLIAPALPLSEENDSLLSAAGFRKRKPAPWCSSLIDLGMDEATLRARLTSTWRNRLKQSQRAGLVLNASNSTEAVNWLLAKHQENMQVKHFKGPKTSLVNALYEARPSDITILSATLDERVVGGMLIARFGVTAEYYIGWFGAPEGRKANCGNFLYWSAAMEMQKAGFRWLDLGGYYSNDTFGHFKQGMGGTEYKLIGEWCSL